MGEVIIPLQALALIRFHGTVLLESNGLDGDEAGRVAGLKGADLVHGALAHVVQVGRVGAAAQDTDAALEGAAPHLARHTVLGGHDGALEVLALRREVEAVVEAAGPPDGGELVAQRAYLAVQRQAFEVHVRDPEDGQPRRFVAAARLDPDEPVFHNVDAAHAVTPRKGVGRKEELERAGGGAGRGGEFGGDAGLEGDGEVLGLGRRRRGRNG